MTLTRWLRCYRPLCERVHDTGIAVKLRLHWIPRRRGAAGDMTGIFSLTGLRYILETGSRVRIACCRNLAKIRACRGPSAAHLVISVVHLR
jgi:hypothetical protein